MTAATRTRAPRSDAAKNRAALLDAARAVLNRDPEASIDVVAAEAGLSRRSVYGHFASREALIAELAQLGAARVAAAVDALHDPDPVLDIALVGRLVWDDVADVRAMTRSVVRGPLREQVLSSGLGPIHARIVADVELAARAGTARTDLDVETVAHLVEGAAFAVLDESIRRPMSREEGRRLVVLAGLGALGLGWREAQAVLEQHAARLLDEAADR
ncbi:TetR/AcrR family transcriptional regulator [uncultured Amnibacterium sp.]|uniref:TetR/AcrR family transcriptional regulator n=1 Tax=uncultured Amnibacterium sp. TaxID=1631851 RepID=UPI0035CC04E8